jgi:hypothetical protein
MSSPLQSWLKKKDLEDLYEPLNGNGITVEMLNTISTETLNEIGLKIGQRKRLFAATGHVSKKGGDAKVHPDTSPSSAAPPPASSPISINFSPVMTNSSSNANTNTANASASGGGGTVSSTSKEKTTRKCVLCRGNGTLNDLTDTKHADQLQKEPLSTEFFVNGKKLNGTWKSLPVEWQHIVPLRADLLKTYGMEDKCHLCQGTGKVKQDLQKCEDCHATGIGIQKFFFKRVVAGGGCCSAPKEQMDDAEAFHRWWEAAASHPDKALLQKIAPFPKVFK